MKIISNDDDRDKAGRLLSIDGHNCIVEMYENNRKEVRMFSTNQICKVGEPSR